MRVCGGARSPFSRYLGLRYAAWSWLRWQLTDHSTSSRAHLAERATRQGTSIPTHSLRSAP